MIAAKHVAYSKKYAAVTNMIPKMQIISAEGFQRFDISNVASDVMAVRHPVPQSH